MKRIALLSLAAGLIALLFPQCAKVVSPTGGPKDTLAPIMTRSTPLPNATNFKGNEFTFTFNEYVQLDNYQQQLLVSPPLKRSPSLTMKGKKVVLTISDTLLDNTTYTIYLGNAIKDLNEGNPYQGFEFAFATGATIDSLFLSGTVIDGFSNKPVAGVMVMLYAQPADSAPYRTRPNHVARSNAEGRFAMSNLKPLNYQVVALLDRNADYLYNQGTERIGFLSNIDLQQYIFALHDTTAQALPPLRMFGEERPQLNLLTAERPTVSTFRLFFSKSPKGQYTITPLNFEPTTQPWYIYEPDANGDTIKFWISDTTLFKFDTLSIGLNYSKTDEQDRPLPTPDTVHLVNYEQLAQKAKAANSRNSRRGGNQQSQANTQSNTGHNHDHIHTSVAAQGKATPNKPLSLSLPSPAQIAHPELVTLFHIDDSTMLPTPTLIADSISPLIYHINHNWLPKQNYTLTIPSNVFELINGTELDTLILTFSGADPEQYGEINIKLSNFDNPVLIELLTEQNKTAASQWIQKPSNGAQFKFITPAKYKLRIVDDRNGNRQWDSGNYLKGIQPEQTYIYEQDGAAEINVRANWENSIEFSKPL